MQKEGVGETFELQAANLKEQSPQHVDESEI